MRYLLFIFLMASIAHSQGANPVAASPDPEMPKIEPGVSQDLAKWRAAHYSDVRYKLNLTLEKMSPVLKGTIEIRVNIGARTPVGVPAAASASGVTSSASAQGAETPPIVLDWRKIKGYEDRSTISNVSLNGKRLLSPQAAIADEGVRVPYEHEHLIFSDGVVMGENVIKLDFTSPILTSGSAITRYVDKEDGSEYIYSLFVPSDASTAFPVFDQPDLKAKVTLIMTVPFGWKTISNSAEEDYGSVFQDENRKFVRQTYLFQTTKPISTYVFAFATGPFEAFEDTGGNASVNERASSPAGGGTLPNGRVSARRIYVRKSQSEKFRPHEKEVFRLNREAVKFFEEYFDYKFPWPKYDLVLIPEFPFGGMEHAGATFLRESSVIFPQEPTKNDQVSRATLIFHETAHQWFGDTVTMRWFDDLWLKEGFATSMAYKAMEKIMPETNSWKVFYERIKQGAYATDSTKGTTPIYQEIKNLSAAKSAYGNIVYNKAPAFLRQAEFYLGEDKFQTAVRSFLKKHEFGNAGWEDLVKEFEEASNTGLQSWATQWVTQRGLPIFRSKQSKKGNKVEIDIKAEDVFGEGRVWGLKSRVLIKDRDIPEFEFSDPVVFRSTDKVMFGWSKEIEYTHGDTPLQFVFPNYGDYGYGIFLLDDKSREYVLKNIQNEKDPFLRSMMWGALWDSVREGELDPREYVELAIKNLPTETDESIAASILGRTGTAMNYYLSAPGDLQRRLENILIERMQNAPTLGQRITYYRAFLNAAQSENARGVLKAMLKSEPPASAGGFLKQKNSLPHAGGTDPPLRTKDKFEIVTRLLILNDPDAPKLLADLEKSETGDDAKRYAYAAKAGIPTAENKAKYWNDFTANKEISESWIEAAFGPWNSIRHSELTLPYLQKALQELPNHKRNRKIFFVNGWLGAFIGGQRSEEALAIVNKFLADDTNLDNDLRLKILENVDLIERAVKIRNKYRK